MPQLTDVVDQAAVTLCGLEPDDQAAALAAGLETVADMLSERDDLNVEQVRAVCCQLEYRVNRRLAQFAAFEPDVDAFH